MVGLSSWQCVLHATCAGLILTRAKAFEAASARETLTRLIGFLKHMLDTYLLPLTKFVLPAIYKVHHPDRQEFGDDPCAAALRRVLSTSKKDILTILVNSLPGEQYAAVLEAVLQSDVPKVLIVGDSVRRDEETIGPGNSDSRLSAAEATRRPLLHLFKFLEVLGVGAGKTQRVFAEVMNKLMTEHVTRAYSDDWRAPSTAPAQLRDWVMKKFVKLVIEVLRYCQNEYPPRAGTDWKLDQVSPDDIARWQDMAIARLGRLRVKELFDIVVDWDSSEGAIQDLKACVGELLPPDSADTNDRRT